jgi:hypothetical protein
MALVLLIVQQSPRWRSGSWQRASKAYSRKVTPVCDEIDGSQMAAENRR